MLIPVRQEKKHHSLHATAQATLPGWVRSLFHNRPTCGQKPASTSLMENGLPIEVTETSYHLLIETRIPDASSMKPLTLQRRTVEAYHNIHRTLNDSQPKHAIRIWNFVPNIQAVLPHGLDRYMIFNAGRYAAYYDWYASKDSLESSIATATGIGHDGSDLIIYVLASTLPAAPVENPRQVRSYRYSSQYGPLPPCFARASLTSTEVPDLPDLLIGGTASVCGEKSTHDNNIVAQAKETITNLAYLVDAAEQLESGSNTTNTTVNVDAQLRRFETMRIYYRDTCHLDTIMSILHPHINHLDPSAIEVVHADICRRELLVEIEGTATLGRSSRCKS